MFVGSWFVIICRIVSGFSSVLPPGSRLRISASMSGKVDTRPPPPLNRGNAIRRLTMEGRGELRNLVFEDESAGDEGLLDCPVVASPR